MQEALLNHLKTGSTTVCRAWKVTRADGETLGFTDHDNDLFFDGVTFVARTGLTARALQQTTGFAVDNSEAMGALSDVSVREEDILSGRYDNAEVVAYKVNWQNVLERSVLFRGTFGEMTRAQGMFQVELRGLTAALNRPIGDVYHSECSAVLGDKRCKVDLSASQMSIEVPIIRAEGGRLFHFDPLPGFVEHWFEYGRLIILDGQAHDLVGFIKTDRAVSGERVVELWQTFAAPPKVGDTVRLEAGCDKRGSTCRQKFSNFLNFRGFPHIPGDDWLRAAPSSSNGG